ncbi:hypothetical protein MMC15_006676 [Xylographa vitiligo]|nr:hypothetical protein [Xylographa vitiligo]
MHTFICLTLVVVEAILAAPIAAVAMKRAEVVKGVDNPKDVLPSWIYVGHGDEETTKVKREDKVPDWTYVSSSDEETTKVKREDKVPDWTYVSSSDEETTKVKREDKVPDWTYVSSSDE